MPMRVTGMYSGLDTESIIQELVAAKQTKVDDAKKDKIKLGWKQDAWKELNTKLKSFRNKYLSNMRFSDAYTKKTTKVSNSNAASVITDGTAPNSVQTLQILKMAKNAYMTGAKVQGKNGTVNALTKLSDLKDKDGNEVTVADGTTISLTVGGESTSFEIKADTTISDVLTQLKNAGLNASFDEKEQRFFINSQESGKAGDFTISSSDNSVLSAFGLDMTDSSVTDPSKGRAAKVNGQDAEILLNNAYFTSSTNVFQINGLTITALDETGDEKITLTTETDTDGIYDLIKGFLKDYNELINEMDKLYNADSAKGYEPLTSEEKQSLSESEIEEWEKKIKDSVLRRDDNLSTIRTAFKQIMSGGAEVNGKTMHLFDFGIDTLGYFNAEENERNAYHIDGDPDDENTMGNDDKLRAMITSDPDTVIAFFTGLTRQFYSKMDEMSKSVEGYRSFGSFYDDKKLKSDYESYDSKIKDLEDKLTAYEDKWYAKFSKMETAMAKMQSNSNAITSLLGGGA